MAKNYAKTLRACYLGYITQAITANFIPMLFLKLHADYDITLGQIALIPTLFFLTQLIVDLLSAKFVDRIGYRKCVIASEVTSAMGLIGLTILPECMPDPFVGTLLCVIVYAIGSGLLEVLVSPIVEACPFEHKDAVMSTLHSFYCWGCVGVVAVSALFFHFAGIDQWKWMALLWALIPLYNIYNFLSCPIEHLVEDGKGMTIRQLFSTPLFWLAILLMACAGASELSMAQWASAYAESALGLSKTLGDLLGPCLFAAAQGACRAIYGKMGGRLNLVRCMFFAGLLCLACYVLASFCTLPVLGLVGCVLCGFAVGIMWPGSLSLCSAKLPAGGTAMFALLAMAGDMGCSIGPGLVGTIAQGAGDQLQVGMRVGCIFPVLLMVGLYLMNRAGKRSPLS